MSRKGCPKHNAAYVGSSVELKMTYSTTGLDGVSLVEFIDILDKYLVY
jgi:hypothetical protein